MEKSNVASFLLLTGLPETNSKTVATENGWLEDQISFRGV